MIRRDDADNVQISGRIESLEIAVVDQRAVLLADNGTTIVKFYLHISKDEQRQRLIERQQDLTKQWKFNPADLKSRAQWDEYMSAYSQAIAATSTDHAPWYVVPANSKLQRNLIVANAICDTLESLKLAYPKPLPGIEKIKVE